jgi:hypothetical protein
VNTFKFSRKYLVLTTATLLAAAFGGYFLVAQRSAAHVENKISTLRAAHQPVEPMP